MNLIHNDSIFIPEQIKTIYKKKFIRDSSPIEIKIDNHNLDNLETMNNL